MSYRQSFPLQSPVARLRRTDGRLARRCPASSRLVLILPFLAFTLTAAPAATASAQALNGTQQACVNAINKATAKLAKAQGKAGWKCVKDGYKGKLTKLGNADQEQTVAACPSNDPKGKLDKQQAKLIATETDDCTADPPPYGFSSSEQAAGAARTQGAALLVDLLGFDPNQTTTVLSPGTDDQKCQVEVVKRTAGMIDALWKSALKAKKAALAGKKVAQVTSSGELQAALLGYLDADDKGKIQKAADKLTDKTVKACHPQALELRDLFDGRCADAPSFTDLGTCAATIARCRFCRALNVTDDLALDCDDFDDSTANASCPGLASARVITSSGEFVTGPLAHGQIGDYIMENGVARFVIQHAPVRDIYSVGTFGGNIIDAELVGHPGLDNFLEIQPMMNIETVIDATSVEIVNDGTDGGAAVIRSCGPDDLLDFVNPSTVVEDIGGLPFPAAANDKDANIEGCTAYTLEPGADYLKMETTVYNMDPTEVALFVGDFLNAAGEVEQWTSGPGGIGEILTADEIGALSYIGYGEATGVDYSYVPISFEGGKPDSSFLGTSGVIGVLSSASVIEAVFGTPAKFEVPGNGSKSYVRYFGVGDGSGANAIDLENLVRTLRSGTVQGCVTVGGSPAVGARVSAGPESGGALTGLSSNWTTDSSGCYSGSLPEGNYGVAAWAEGAPFEGGGSTPLVHPVTIDADVPVVENIALPATGHVDVTVVDENSDAVPARVSIVGFDPSPEYVFGSGSGAFRDQKDPVPFGLTRVVYTDAAGTASFDLEPGSYEVFVSRGTEYSLYQAPLVITAGMTTGVAAQIAHVLDTDGFVSSDFHVHGINSADSRVSHHDRVFQFAGEGTDNVIMTDHHAHTDLNPRIAALGFTNFLHATIGEEITTWDTGHYNAYPLTIDPTRQSGGSTDWGKAAPPGEDFPAYGNYIAEPSEVYTLATTGPQSTADTVIQINHIDSHFVPMKIDTSLVPPQSSISVADRTRYRMDPAGGELFFPFPALELWNGAGRGDQSQFLDERMGIWMNELNQGILPTFIADTDTHRFTALDTAGARTWTSSSTDDPASISDSEIAQAVWNGRAVGGQGIYVQTQLVANEDPGIVADFTLGGTTLISITDPVQGVELEIDVQAPLWAQFDTIEIYANAATTPSPTKPAVAELFSATPTMVLHAGTDFTVTENDVFPAVTGGKRLEASTSVEFANLGEDTWFVVVVKGTDGVSEPMFPVYPKNLATNPNMGLGDLLDGNLGQSGTMALGATNALYVDADGVAGFQAPLAP
jgi:hypothetical protein